MAPGELSEYMAGELDAEAERRVGEHLEECAACRALAQSLFRLDEDLRLLPRETPSADAIFNVRRALAAEIRQQHRPELMTLEEVADFLRISLDGLEEIVLDLPAFEVAGQLRVRRAKLLEWIEERERSFRRTTVESEVARSFSVSL
jgi:hypothetical protein